MHESELRRLVQHLAASGHTLTDDEVYLSIVQSPSLGCPQEPAMRGTFAEEVAVGGCGIQIQGQLQFVPGPYASRWFIQSWQPS